MKGKSFRDFATDELEKAYPPISNVEANFRAADRVLEGYRDMSDAGYDADHLEQQGSIRYDAFGWPFDAETIRWAIWVKAHKLVKSYTKGIAIMLVNGETGVVQGWGRPGKRGKPIKASRKEAVRSGNPYIYVWIHNPDFSEERWEWIKAA